MVLLRYKICKAYHIQWVVEEREENMMNSRNCSYQSDFYGQSFVCGGSALQLLQGFSLVGNRRITVLVGAGRVPVASAEAGVGAPVGQTVATSEIIDGEWWAGGNVKVCKLSQVVVVLR